MLARWSGAVKNALDRIEGTWSDARVRFGGISIGQIMAFALTP